MTKAFLPSPIGSILIDCDGTHLLSVHIVAGDIQPPASYGDAAPGTPAAEAVRQLRAYFADGSTCFDLPLLPMASARGEALRAAIAAIPPGGTLSYGAVARSAQSGARAIGQACSRNVFPIVIPCHRVVGSGGAMGHYSAGRGIITKSWLLDHERRGGLL